MSCCGETNGEDKNNTKMVVRLCLKKSSEHRFVAGGTKINRSFGNGE